MHRANPFTRQVRIKDFAARSDWEGNGRCRIIAGSQSAIVDEFNANRHRARLRINRRINERNAADQSFTRKRLNQRFDTLAKAYPGSIFWKQL
jgi:hypothetical protein